MEEIGVGEEEKEKVRRSKDGKVNKEGRILVEFIKERGWSIFNGVVKGDEEEEYTYTGGRGNTVIDYVIGDREVREKVCRMVIREKVDHHSIEVTMEGGRLRGSRKRGGRRRNWRGVWDEEGIERFRQKLGEVELGEGEVKEEWEKLEKRVKVAVERIERERERRGGGEERRGW